ncbi:hypothetical protein HPB49_026570 [Dermacentor silvarum]|nr:hypothetical protein HPB49_026570 [Dermacentor silvarum]
MQFVIGYTRIVQSTKLAFTKIYIGVWPIVLLSSAEAVEVLMKSNTLLDKALLYGLMNSWLGTGLLTSPKRKWRARRKLLTPAFHFKLLDDFVPVMVEHSRAFSKRLRALSQQHRQAPIDVVPLVSCCTLDVICETAMGVSVNAQEDGEAPYVKAIKVVLHIHVTLKNDLQLLTKMVTELEAKLNTLPSKQPVSNENTDISKIQNKVDDLENRSRRLNVLFFGINDSNAAEPWENSERHVREFCTQKLGIAVTSVARAHRLGRFSTDKKRPIIAKFYNEKEVESVLSLGYKLKNTNLSISRDYSKAVRLKRRGLWQFSKTIRKEGDRIRLSFDKLRVNNDVYLWDTTGNRAVRVSESSSE